MAKNQVHSSYQKGVIKRYYENIEDLSVQKVGEIVSNLYLETNQVVKLRLWNQAEKALLNLSKTEEAQNEVKQVIKSRNIQNLAKLLEKLF